MSLNRRSAIKLLAALPLVSSCQVAPASHVGRVFLYKIDKSRFAGLPSHGGPIMLFKTDRSRYANDPTYRALMDWKVVHQREVMGLPPGHEGIGLLFDSAA